LIIDRGLRRDRGLRAFDHRRTPGPPRDRRGDIGL